jgi:hypothetical protein
MSRRNMMAAMGLIVVALLIAVTVYVSNLKAADLPPSKKTPAAPTSADQIKQLQARIDLLEKRIATLEQSPTPFLVVPNSAPQLNVVPRLNFAPAPPATGPEEKNDGFPPARFLLIDGKPTVTNDNPPGPVGAIRYSKEPG